jgi:SOS response regulatory protein OraA/RecX
MPAEVVLTAGLDMGIELDRLRARRVGRELRRYEAMARAARSLARRDLSERRLTERLARAKVAPAERREAVGRLLRSGAVDDERLALRRAELLADRGAGDELIRQDLADRAIAAELIERALAALEPEVGRASRVVEGRGASLKTARYLARKGFAQDSIDAACGDPVAEDAPRAVP